MGTPIVRDNAVHMEQMSYYARITDAQTFTDQWYAEMHRRGYDGAQQVAVVSDGAEWIQAAVDAYRPDAVRILDAMHACQRLAAISLLLFPQAPQVAERWYLKQRTRLLAGKAEHVIASLHRWQRRCPAIGTDVAYLMKRVKMLAYATWRQEHWPIGSGSVESGNRHVMPARLKGAGMHWTVTQANALLALRCLLANQRWDEVLSLLERHRMHGIHDRHVRQQERLFARRSVAIPSQQEAPERIVVSPVLVADVALSAPSLPPTSRSRRPQSDHPWLKRCCRPKQPSHL